MRITSQLLRAKSGTAPLHSVSFVDLKNLSIAVIEKLELCPKLESLILRGNDIESVINLEQSHHLWTLDLTNNKVKSLDGLSRFVAFGTLVLSHNALDWPELAKLRHMHILHLSLVGNPQLENDPHYRMHVIDCLPHLWMLDGGIITSKERLQVEQFFEDTEFSEHPVRHKFPKDIFIPSSLQNIHVKGIYGKNATELLRRFPTNGPQNIEMDVRHLKYISSHIQGFLEQEESNRKRKNRLGILGRNYGFIDELLGGREDDKERGNVFLILLVASLEFFIPVHLMKKTLEVCRLTKIGDVETMDIFLLPKDIRCTLICILLSGAKIDQDKGEEGGLYNRLYLSLYYLMQEIVKLQISSHQSSKKIKKTTKSQATQDCRSLLASEVVQLFCIVPEFFEYLDKDLGIMNMIASAAGDVSVMVRLHQIFDHLSSHKEDAKSLREEMSQLLHNVVQAHASKVLNKSIVSIVRDQHTEIDALPKRSKSSRLNSAEFLAIGRHTPQRERPTIRPVKPKIKHKIPDIGDSVLLGPQNIGRIITIPETYLAQVQMDVIPVANGAMVSNVKDSDEHYVYIDLRKVEWDHKLFYWRPKGTIGDRLSIQPVDQEKPDELMEVDVDSRSENSPRVPSVSFSRPTTVKQRPHTSRPTYSETPRPMSAVLAEKLQLEIEPKSLENLQQGADILEKNLYDCIQCAVETVTANLPSKKQTVPAQVFLGELPASVWRTSHGQIIETTTSQPGTPRVGSASTYERIDQIQQAPVQKSGLTEKTSEKRIRSSQPTPRREKTPEILNRQRETSKSAVMIPAADEITIHQSACSQCSKEKLLQSPAISLNFDRETTDEYRAKTPTPVIAKFSSELKSTRPMSAIDAYSYFRRQQKLKTESEDGVFHSEYQHRRTEAWRESAKDIRKSPSKIVVKDESMTNISGSAEPPSTDHTAKFRISIKQGDDWLARGRDVYIEEVIKRTQPAPIPGWKDGLKHRAKSAQRPCSSRPTTPNYLTTSMINSSVAVIPMTPVATPLYISEPQISSHNIRRSRQKSPARVLPRHSMGVVCLDCHNSQSIYDIDDYCYYGHTVTPEPTEELSPERTETVAALPAVNDQLSSEIERTENKSAKQAKKDHSSSASNKIEPGQVMYFSSKQPYFTTMKVVIESKQTKL
ncbi:uncharacterized protein LOC141898782 [Tubulanus polymorphus]|uniref:uncharacterized protein LOC141898782 n=1 Tax=Tubulanus polymorphus TaxID=672921 RepID=UPI003DA6C418